MNQLIVHVAKWKLRLYAWAHASSLLNHSYRLHRLWQKRRSFLEVSFTTPSSLRASDYEWKVTVYYQMAIDYNSFKNEGWMCAAIL